MEKFSGAAEKIIRDYLKVSPEERFFIITDKSSGFPSRLSKACYKVSRKQGIETRIVKQQRISYGMAAREVTRLLKGLKRNDCLMLCLDGKLGSVYMNFNKGLRSLLRSNGIRFVTMVGLSSLKSEDRFLDALSADIGEMRERGRKIKELLDSGKTLEVTGRSGTRIKCSIEGRKAWFNSGEFYRPGQGGNLPAGDITIFPVEGSVEGKVMIDLDLKVEADTVRVNKPIEIELENGEIAQIHGDKALVERMYNDLNNFSLINARQGFDSRGIFRVSEIGFGIVPGKPIGLSLMDKSMEGICGIATGNSWGKGGRNKCRGHRKHLFWLKNVKIDGKLIKI